MKKILLISFIFIFSTEVWAYEDFSKEDIKKLSAVEKSVFGKTSRNSDYEKRLKDAEKKVFGAVQSGNLEDRINFLGTVVETGGYYNPINVPVHRINTPIGIIRNAIVQRQGVVTGFTPPPLPPKNNYKDDYNKPFYRHKNVPPMYRNINGNNNFNNRLIRTY